MLVEITRSNKKCTKCVCYFYGKVKGERITATSFSVIQYIKNEEFLFFKQNKNETRLAFAQEAHAPFKEPQNNSRLTK